MKSLFLSTALAAGLGALAMSPAAALTVKAPVAVTPTTTDVACRMVEKRVSNNGVTRITKSRECDNDRYDRRSDRGDRRYVDRRYDDRRDRRDDRPGFNIRLGQ